jgi:CHAT domain-containing protein
MFELDLKSCQLAVLSVDDSRILGRGMLASGAKRVVTTNWSIADDASAYLTYYFIDKVSASPNPDYAAALQQAKQDIRKLIPEGKDKPVWQHPFYWAPFVLTGPN